MKRGWQGWTAMVSMVIALGMLQTPSQGEELEPEHAKLSTGDASPVDPGGIELSLGYEYGHATRAWDADGHRDERRRLREQSLTLGITYGLIEDVDLAVEVPYVWVHDDDNDHDEDGALGPNSGHGLGDVGVSGRWRFLHLQSAWIEVAWVTGFTLPSGTSSNRHHIGTSQEYWTWENAVVATLDRGHWTYNAELGCSLPFGDDREGERGSVFANLASGYQVTSWLQPEIELNYGHDYRSCNDCDSDSLAATAGVLCPFAGHYRLSIGLQQILWGKEIDDTTTFLIGFTVSY